jgi:hypothetical protein
MEVFTEVISNLSTMGASNFSEFVLSFFVDFFYQIIERLYAAPYLKVR